MLVEFRVKNFKSIRDEQVLSLVANSDKSHEDTHVVNTKGGKLRLLKSAVIYGANASGKSNLVEAFNYMRMRIKFDSIGARNGRCKRFRLDTESNSKPSEFEVSYIQDEIRYQYGFSLQNERVVEEWLLVYESDKPQEWFSRKISPDTGEDVYKFSSHLRGPKKTWEKTTREDALFLSIAARLNSEQLGRVFYWLSIKFRFLKHDMLPPQILLSGLLPLLEDERYKKGVLDFLYAADLGIQDVLLITEERRATDVRFTVPSDGKNEISKLKPLFSHHVNGGGYEFFELEDESAGTQRLFRMSFEILQVMRSGDTLIVDELESSLHPLLLRFVVNLFNSAENKSGAQLIFTTHNSDLLDNKIFRRDQIWFTEKDDSHATVLYPLTDFSPRKSEALASGYLSGRFGAIPFLSDFKIGETEDARDGA